MNKLTDFNWFDFLVLVVIALGIWRGRKRGISEELLDVLQWLCIVVGGGFLYKSLGLAIQTTTHLSLLASNILAYASIAILIKLLFTGIKRAVGEKLVESDAFGSMEYYLGMLGGALRFICILIFAINFLHARYISDAERAATAKLQQDNFGSISFPTFGSLQQDVFYKSISGPFIKKYLHEQLLEPVTGKSKPHENIYERRERAVEEILK